MTDKPLPCMPGLDEAALLAERLTATIEKESALLVSPRPAAILDVQEKKERLAQSWAACCHALRAHADSVAKTSAPAKARLAEATRALAEALERNEKLLRAATQATDRIVGAIVGAVRDHRSQAVGYARQGAMRQPVYGTAGITLNRAL